MKKYIFITLNLCAMNGADMYIYNKKEYLEKNGYQAYVFSGVKGEIFIHGLKNYTDLQSGYLRIYPGCFRKKAVMSVLDWMICRSGITEGDDVIVESSNLISSMWAELLAQKLKCRHLCFVLTERLKLTETEKAYFRFKLDRHELAGISKKSIPTFLEDDTIPDDDTMSIRAFCSNTIDQCEDTVSQYLKDADLTIGSIGRIDKPYVLPLVTELSRIFSRNPQKKYNLVMIGGARAEKQTDRLKAVFAGNPNVNCVFTGPLFPIPIDFVNRCDLFISAAGSANATYIKRKATILLNPNTAGIVGIPGLTYQYGELGTFSDQYPLSDLEQMIAMANEKKQDIIYVYDGEGKKMAANTKTEFERQLKYIERDNPFEYYDTFQIKHESKSYKIFNVLGKVMNGNNIERSMELMRRLFK